MRRPLLLLLLAATLPAAAGTVEGTVRATGKEGADPRGGASGLYESRRLKFAPRVDYAALKDFVVYVEGPVTGGSAPAREQKVVIQKDAIFSPHVLPVAVGTTIEWPNNDEIFHNVFSFSDAKQFDLGLYKSDVKKVTFDKPGRIDVFCSIHANMHCIILVLENPFFSATDAAGHYRLEGLPAGTFKIRAWHERLPPQTLEVTVPAEGTVQQDFQLGIKGLPQY